MIKLKDKGTPPNNFILLYTCFSLLLLSFFIFLVANSTIDSDRTKEAIGSLLGSFGLLKGGISNIGDQEKKKLGIALIPLSKESNVVRDLYEMVKLSKKDDSIVIEIKDGVINLKFVRNSIFKSNEIIISNEYVSVLSKLVYRIKELKNLDLQIVSLNSNDISLATSRGVAITNFMTSSDITSDSISCFSKLSDSNIELIIAARGLVSESNTLKENSIKKGDFIFEAK